MDIPGLGALQRLPSPILSSTAESAPSPIGLITLGAKRTGKLSAGNPHAGFDVAGAGNGAMGRIEAPARCESRRQRLLPVS